MSNFHQYGKGDATHSGENQQYASLVEQLDLMIRARYPLLYVISVEEKPVEEVLQQVALRSVPKRQLLFWDIVRGWSDMRNLMGEFKRSPNIIIITSHTLELPDELLQEVTVVDFPLPSVGEIDNLIQQLVVPDKLNVSGLAREQLVKACQGLSRTRISRVLAKALAAKQQVNESDIDGVLEEKKQAIRQTGILEFFTPQESLKRVGGLDQLKQWVLMRQDAFTEEARRYVRHFKWSDSAVFLLPWR